MLTILNSTALKKSLRAFKTARIRELTASLGADEPEKLIAILQDPSQQVETKRNAMSLLGLLRAKCAIPVLVASLQDPDFAWAAANSLIDLSSLSATRRLMAKVKTLFGLEQRKACVYVLSQLPDKRALLVLFHIALEQSEDADIRAIAISGLGPLMRYRRVLRMFEKFRDDHSANVRYAAVCALSGAMPRSSELIAHYVEDKVELPNIGRISDLASRILLGRTSRSVGLIN